MKAADTSKYILEKVLVANPDDGIYTMGTMLGHADFANTDKQIPMALGQNDDGAPIIYDLAQMGHLLVGHGTWNLFDPIIASLAMRFTPDECQIVYISDDNEKWTRLPHMTLITEDKFAIETLKEIAASIPERTHNKNRGHMVILIPDLCFSFGINPKDPSLSRAIQTIIHHGAAAGIHLIAGATKPYETDPDLITAFPMIVSTKPAFGQVERVSETLFGDDRACHLATGEDYLIGPRGGEFTHMHINAPKLSADQAKTIVSCLIMTYKHSGKVLGRASDMQEFE